MPRSRKSWNGSPNYIMVVRGEQGEFAVDVTRKTWRKIRNRITAGESIGEVQIGRTENTVIVDIPA